MQGTGAQQTHATDARIPLSGVEARRRLIAGLPVVDRRASLAGISTAFLEGGTGTPLVLLHDPGGYAAKWRDVIPELVREHRVIAPDLPGHGESELPERLDAEITLRWLGELIERTCTTPPVVVGVVLGGAIAARFATRHPALVRQLVLVDSLGLQPFDPAPEFGSALGGFLANPSESTHDTLWRYCAHDLDALRARMSDTWEPFAAYNLDRARSPQVQAALRTLMEQFGFPPIPDTDLSALPMPTTLIWGRHDLATSVAAARRASARFGWPLHVIEDCGDDPLVEQPRAFLDALRSATSQSREVRT